MNGIQLLEEWRDVAGFEGRYQVSNTGRVWSYLTNRILRPGPNSKGYLTVSLMDGSIPKRPRSHCVHDLVGAAFIGAKPAGMTVDHNDTNKRNNRASNLEYCTRVENNRRAHVNGLMSHYRGGAHPNAKLNDEQAVRIRLAAMRTPLAILAQQYGVSEPTIRSIVRGKSYHVA